MPGREGYNFVFIDETWIDTAYTAKYCWQNATTDGVTAPVSRRQRLIVVHGGSKEGFVPGALLIYKASSATSDYHSEINGANFLKRMKEKLLPNLKTKSAIIMDNASCHSVLTDKCPTLSTRKADIQKWLRDHDIPFEDDLLRPQLLALAKLQKPGPTYLIDNIVSGYGHEVLQLLPYHPDLNAIELILSQVKQIVVSRNMTHRINDVLQITTEAFEDIESSRWENACKHTDKCEEQYRSKDTAVDLAFDRLVINLADDTDSEATDTASEGEDSIDLL